MFISDLTTLDMGFVRKFHRIIGEWDITCLEYHILTELPHFLFNDKKSFSRSALQFIITFYSQIGKLIHKCLINSKKKKVAKW